MQITDTENKYIEICNCITEKKLSGAFKIIESILEQNPNAEYKNVFEKQKQTYSYLLEYSFKGVDDPERPNIYRNIQIALIELAENIKHNLLLKESGSIIFYEKKVLENEILRSNINITQVLKLMVSEESSETNQRKETLNKVFFFNMVY